MTKDEMISSLQSEIERLKSLLKIQKASCSLVKTVEAANLKDENAQLRAERDAAVAELALSVNKCRFCVNAGCWKRNGTSECKFKWRGAKGEK